MEKKESQKLQDIKNSTLATKKLKSARNSNNKSDKSLPWWVELLFVQIGLPDKWLIKVLKTKKKGKEFIKNEKKLIVLFLIFFTGLAYFYPLVKYSKTKLDCENAAQKYFSENKNINKLNKKKIKILSFNFCNGGDEIYEFKNVKNYSK